MSLAEPAPTDRAASAELDDRLNRVVPGGAHTYAKGRDQFPVGLAPVMQSGRGCRTTDVDGNEYVEWGMGLRTVTLGHGYEPVARAVAEAALAGTNFGRPSSLELEAAEAFVELVPGADMVKFTKDGSSANTAAVKLARAVTGRNLVAFCREHPFFSYDDWFIATTEVDGGIPPAARAETLTFGYNDLSALERLFEEWPGEIGCVMLEPARIDEPEPGFLSSLATLTRERGAVLVFDECVTGFRWDVPGAQSVYGVVPDLSTFGKGIANGFALSALVGRRELMERGGLEHDEARVFLLSTTHGAERVGLAAGLATWRAYAELPVVDTLTRPSHWSRSQVGSATSDHTAHGRYSSENPGGRSSTHRRRQLQLELPPPAYTPSCVAARAGLAPAIRARANAAQSQAHARRRTPRDLSRPPFHSALATLISGQGGRRFHSVEGALALARGIDLTSGDGQSLG